MTSPAWVSTAKLPHWLNLPNSGAGLSDTFIRSVHAIQCARRISAIKYPVEFPDIQTDETFVFSFISDER